MMPVWVVWLDATSQDEWQSMDEAKKLYCHKINTFGFLLEDKMDRLILALNHDTDSDNVSQVVTIPKAWIQEIKFYPAI